jgi:hypothetical protein
LKSRLRLQSRPAPAEERESKLPSSTPRALGAPDTALTGVQGGVRRGFALLAATFVAALAAIFLSGCQVLLATAEPFPTDTPTPTLSPTVTIQWFPSTATPTPGAQRPLLAATPNQRPALGETVLTDTFSDSAAWQTYQTTSGSATISGGRLTLAAPEFSANMVSLRRGTVPQDFYMEITAATSLCRGKDNYGLVFRSDGAASQYRLIVSCDGYLRVERWRPNEAAAVQDWTPSGQIPTGGPQSLRLGLWMIGSEMRVFINDVFQFAVRDPTLDGQQMGVFLHSTGANAATISFTNLVVKSISNYLPSPVPSATPVVTIYPTRAPYYTPTPLR